jgi:dihydrofolate reductase
MRKVILQEFVTLDGLAAGPNDSVDFVPNATQGDQSLGREQMGLIDTIDTILLGRVTYRLFAEYWPNVSEGEDKAFADKLNAIPKIVFSKTLDRAPWGKWDEAKVVRNSAADEVAKLKRQTGKDMVLWGSLSVAQSLMDARLIDEYGLVVCPVVLGSGRPLFRDAGEKRDMTLLETRAFDRGSVLLKYRAASAPSADTRAGQTAGEAADQQEHVARR